MVSRCKYSGSAEIGAFCILTNDYAVVPYCNKHFINHFTMDFPSTFPVIKSSIAGTCINGRMGVGNRHGLLLPATATENEIQKLEHQLPEDVVVTTVDEPFSALGNVIAANDRIALVHPDLDQATMEAIGDTLSVEVVPFDLHDQHLIGTFVKFTNTGGVVSNSISTDDVEQINQILGLELVPASVNRGSKLVSAGICVNDNNLICGVETTALEIATLSRAFHIELEDSSEQTLISNLISDNILITA